MPHNVKKLSELNVGDRRPVDIKRWEFDSMARPLVAGPGIAAHIERPGRNQNDVRDGTVL
jgi:hypothetical protein